MLKLAPLYEKGVAPRGGAALAEIQALPAGGAMSPGTV